MIAGRIHLRLGHCQSVAFIVSACIIAVSQAKLCAHWNHVFVGTTVWITPADENVVATEAD
jgi:hypothetical protein